MIELEGVRARAVPRGELRGASFTSLTATLGPGAWALVDVEPGAARLLLDLAAGHALPSRGRVRVLGKDPAGRGAGVAYVPRDAALPEGMRVRDVAALEATLRGRAGLAPAERLATLGLEGLLERPTAALSRQEARGVALALALSSGAGVVVVEEPYLDMDERATPRLPEAVRALATAGAVVLVSTASRREAALLGAQPLRLEGDRIVPAATSPAGLGVVEVVVADPLQLVARLAEARAMGRVEADAEGLVRVHAPDRVAAARAVMQAAVDAGLPVLRLSSHPPDEGAP